MTWRNRLVGFYAILDRNDEHLARLLVRPVDQGGAGARVLQVRIKPNPPVPISEVLAAARMARSITARAGALLIIDDRIDIAMAVDADGVHLGQDDLPVAEARALVTRLRGERLFLIGVSTHNRDQVAEAVQAGADYLGFGPVYHTETKAHPDPVQGIGGLSEAVVAAGATPVVAIGGITPARASEIASTGAAAACCISAVNNSQNPAEAGARISRAWAT